MEYEQTERERKRDHPRVSNNLQTRDAQPKRSVPPQNDARIQEELLEDLIARWNKATAESAGEDLLHKQWEIEKRVAALGPSYALMRFFDFLASKGANDIRERLISEVGNPIFSESNAEKSRQWLLTLQDRELRENLSGYAGKHLPKEDINIDSGGAVKAITALIPPTMNYKGLVEIMAALPLVFDFALIYSSLPSDKKNIARLWRAAMLQCWTASRPEEAAQYVIATTCAEFPCTPSIVTSKCL